MQFTTVSRMLLALPWVSSIMNVTSAQLYNYGERAEAIVKARLAPRYYISSLGHVDSATAAPAVVTITTDLALYRLLVQRVFTQEKKNQSEYPPRFRESQSLLTDIVKGEMPILDVNDEMVAQRPDVLECWSNKQDFEPTFFEGPDVYMGVDSDKYDGEVDARRDGISWP